MTSISSISAYSTPAPVAQPARVDSDRDGDNDAGKSAAAEASEAKGSFGPATQVTLSPAAQAMMQNK